MKNQPKTYIFYMGMFIFGIGMLLKFIIPDVDGALQAMPFVLTGFGAGIIGVGVVNLFRKKIIENNPQKAKQYEIAEKDERNIILREKAGLATWYITLFTLAIIILTFVILDYKIASFVALGGLFIHIISLFVYINIFNKKL